MLSLAGAGNTRPTAREIADAAGISVRSVYVHFDDLDDLFRAAADRHLAQMAELLTPVDAALPLAERIAAVGRAAGRDPRAVRCGPPRRRAVGTAVPALADVLRQGRTVGRHDIERLFGAELGGRDDEDVALSAITTMMSAEAWDSLPGAGPLGRAAARGRRPCGRPLLEGA